MRQIEFTKSDRLRCGCTAILNQARKQQLELARKNEMPKDEMNTIANASLFQIGQLCVTFAYLENTYTDELGVKMQMTGLVSDNHCPPFIFTDKELVNNILESRIGKIPMDALKLPFDTFVIELPELVEYPDGSGDQWDMCVVMNVEAVGAAKDKTPEAVMDNLENGKVVKRFICAFSNSKNDLFMWFHFPLHEVAALDDGCLIGPDGEIVEDRKDFLCSTVAKAMLMISKLVFFLTSPSCKTEVEKRDKPSAKVPFVERNYFRSIYRVSLNEEAVREYEGESESGRTINVRHRVIGHFKHFTKGRMANRVIWCPPHWRGPEVGSRNSLD